MSAEMCCGICGGDVVQTTTGFAHTNINDVIDGPHYVQPKKVTMPSTDQPNTVIIAKDCPMCGTRRTMAVDRAKYARWQAGELIQRVFPELSASEREFLMTGFCDECWDRMFAE